MNKTSRYPAAPELAVAPETLLKKRALSVLAAAVAAVTAAVIACVPEPPTSPDSPPGVPTDVVARAGGAERIDVTWAPSADAASYRVFRGGELVAEPDTTGYSDTGLAPFTTYAYRVSAVSEAGVEGERSDSAVARTRDASPPGVPGDVTAAGVSPTQIDLTWTSASDPESGVDTYVIYRDDSRAGTSRGTSFSDTGLEPSTSHSYRVAAVNGAGMEGPKSAAVPAETDAPRDTSPPTAPEGLEATAVSPSQIDLRWSAATDPQSGVSSYRVYRNGERVGEASGTSFSDTGLEPSTSHSYRVAAVNGEGIEGPKSSSASARTPRRVDDTPPTAPSELEADAEGPTTVELTWEAASDPESGVSGYRIYRDGDRIAETSGTSFEDTGLSSSTTYRYEVSAVNGDGLEGPRAGPESVETEPDDTPPTAPSELEADAEGPTTVELTWEAASDPESGVSGYRIYRDGDRIAETSGTSFEDTGLSSSTTYRYEVSAVNGDGLEGPRAGPESVETEPDDTPPTAPSELEADAEGPTTVELTWEAASDPESGVSGYRVYRDGDRIAETSGTSFEDTGLSSSTTYRYEVTAVNGEGIEGDPAGPESVETEPDDTPPTAPSELEADAEGPTTVELTWEAASDPESGVSGYRVYRDGDRIAETSGTSFEDTGLSSSTTYRYEVTAVNGEGIEGDPAGPESVETEPDKTPPTVPGDLEAQVQGTERARLDWEPSTDPESGVAFYRVYRDSELIAEVEETGYVDEDLEEGTTYSYQVSAVNGDGYESALTEPVEVTTPPEDDALAAVPDEGGPLGLLR